MDTAEQLGRLDDIAKAMASVQQLAERISGHVIALEAAGLDLPNMRQTATTLAQVALGWAHEPDDPPEVDPEDAEAQRIAETYADAADELRALEAEGWQIS